MKIQHISKSSGKIYEVDLENLTCKCPNYKFRLAKTGGMCKHIIEELDKFEKKIPQALEFIKTEGDGVDAVKFVETFDETLLNILKKRGTVYEKLGRLYKL